MKSRKITVLVALALASGFLISACGKSTDKKSSGEEEPSSELLSSEEEEETIPTTAEPNPSYVEPTDESLTYYQKELGAIPGWTYEDGSDIPKQKDPIPMGLGNASNGGFATANEDYQFFVAHPQKHITTIEMEDSKTGDQYCIYTVKPQKDVESTIDSMILNGDDLYFRENSSKVKKLDLNTHYVETIFEGEAGLLTMYQDMLYFYMDGSIRRMDMDGNNEEVLFTSNNPDGPVNVPFCISGGTIYYTDPQHAGDDGLYYGKLYSMDLDGNNQVELPIQAKVSNSDTFFSDGEKLYFRGWSNWDDGSDFKGNMSIRPDGSDITLYEHEDAAQMNYSNGTLYMIWMDSLWMIDGNNKYEIDCCTDDLRDTLKLEGVVIVGNWIYAMSSHPMFRSGYVTSRTIDETNIIICLDAP